MAFRKTRNSVSQEFFEHVGLRSVSKPYSKGQPIFTQGDAANAVFRVEKGYVKLTLARGKRNRASLAILRTGDCFGERCLLDGSPRPCTATSIQASIIGRTGKAGMLKRLRNEPAFAKLFTGYLLQRIAQLEDDLVSQLTHSSEKRLARLLLQLTDPLNGGSRQERSVPSVDQAILASAVGTTRSRVSYFMNRFRLKRMIDYNGDLQVHKTLLTFLLSKD